MKIDWYGLTDQPASLGPLKTLLSGSGNPSKWYTEVSDLREALKGSAEGAVVFLQLAKTPYELCREISLTHPLVSVILIVPQEEVDLKKAMRMGAVDVIGQPFKKEELAQVLNEAVQVMKLKETALRKESKPDQGKSGHVISVCGTKGGVGKTTLAVNMAVAFAKNNLKVIILDLDLQFGDVAILFDLHPKRTIYELVVEGDGEAKESVERYIVQHRSGVDILPAPNRPELAEVVTGEHIQRILADLKRRYDVVLIDTPPLLVETGLVALENSEDILLISSMEVPTLKNSRLCIDALQAIELKDRVKVVINRDSDFEALRIDTVEQFLGLPVFHRIPSEGKTVVKAGNEGVPFITLSPRAAVSKSLIALTLKLHKLPKDRSRAEAKSTKRSMLARILRK
ncbi:AAA family ATPase [Ammoniphilus sp. 3BR4]|uniref:AAA family ATPase n=1 Tax=Ammoniphilus sp. 3BR4 TaxID=3158265 RepID=UPI003466E2E5